MHDAIVFLIVYGLATAFFGLLLSGPGGPWEHCQNDKDNFFMLLFLMTWPVSFPGLLLLNVALYLNSFWRVMQALLLLTFAAAFVLLLWAFA